MATSRRPDRPHPRAERWPAFALALALLADPACSDAWAMVLSWKLAVNGSAGVAANWIPSQIPGPADNPNFDVAGTYTVTFPASVPSTNAHTYRRGTVTVVASAPHAIGTTLLVGDLAAEIATLALTTGTVAPSGSVTIGNAAGSTGTLRVNDDDADLIGAGTTADVNVGSSGTGTLQVAGGGLVDAADDVRIGVAAGAQGTALVTGFNLGPDVASTLTTSGTNGDLSVGISGSGSLSVTGGGSVIATDDAAIALNSGSQGAVTVDGAVGNFSSHLHVTDFFDIASNTALGPAGTGSVWVANGGIVTVDGVTTVGDPEGGTGTLSIRSGGFFVTRSLTMNNAHGVLDHHGGSLFVTGGPFDPPGTTLLIDDPQFETVVLQNGSTATFDGGVATAYSVIAGDANGGRLALESGSHLTHVTGVLAVGLSPGSNGVLDVTGPSRLDGAGSAIVGLGGAGEVNLSAGGVFSLTEMFVAYAAGSYGFVSVSGSGSRLEVEQLEIGGHGVTAGGLGNVVVGDEGVVDVAGDEVTPLRVHPDATLQVNAGGSIHGGANVDHRGRILMGGGQLTCGSLNFLQDAELVGHGTVAGNIAGSISSGLIHATGGLLVLGSSVSNKGFANSGTLRADASEVRLLDSDAVTLGDVILDQGTVRLPSAGGSVQAGKRWSGVGTVIGALTIAGTVTPGFSAGTLAVSGSYIQSAGGRMEMEIGDAPTNQFDRLNVNGPATLGGTLDIQILDGFVPNPGEEFTLMTYTQRTGTFSAVTIEGQPVNGQFTLLYNPTTVVLHVNQITTDAPLPLDAPRELEFGARSGAWDGASFDLALPEAARVTLTLYGAGGRRLGTLFEGDRPAGRFVFGLDPLSGRLASGVYFGRVRVRSATAESVRSARLVLIR